MAARRTEDAREVRVQYAGLRARARARTRAWACAWAWAGEGQPAACKFLHSQNLELATWPLEIVRNGTKRLLWHRHGSHQSLCRFAPALCVCVCVTRHDTRTHTHTHTHASTRISRHEDTQHYAKLESEPALGNLQRTLRGLAHARPAKPWWISCMQTTKLFCRYCPSPSSSSMSGMPSSTSDTKYLPNAVQRSANPSPIERERGPRAQHGESATTPIITAVLSTSKHLDTTQVDIS